MAVQALEQQVREALPHLAPSQASELADALNRLVEAFDPDRIYLFGSQARGTPQPGSDIDILVVTAADGEPTYRLAARAYTLLAALQLPLELLFILAGSSRNVRRRRHRYSHRPP